MGRAQTVTGTLEQETYWREHRERDETWEGKVKLGFIDRGTVDGTIRIDYEYDDRNGQRPTTRIPMRRTTA